MRRYSLLILLPLLLLNNAAYSQTNQRALPGQSAGDIRQEDALPLRVEITKNGRLLLNGERRDPQSGALYGSVDDSRALRAKLTKILQEREAHPGPDVDRPGTKTVGKTVFIKAPETMKYGEVVKIIDAAKAAGASPIGLQGDGEDRPEPKASVPEKESGFSVTEWGPGLEIPQETPSAEQEPPISSRDALIISIPVDGQVYLGKVRYDVDIKSKDDPERKRLMRDLKKEAEQRTSEERIIYIKASLNVSYGQMVGIIDLVRDPESGGFTEIGLVADRKKKLVVPNKRRRKRTRH